MFYCLRQTSVNEPPRPLDKSVYSKTCLKRPVKYRQNKDDNDK